MKTIKSILYTTIGEYANCASILDYLKEDSEFLAFLELKSRFSSHLAKTTLHIYKNGEFLEKHELLTASPKLVEKFPPVQHIIFFLNIIKALAISFRKNGRKPLKIALTTFSVAAMAMVISKKLGYCEKTVLWHWDYMPHSKNAPKLLKLVDSLDKLTIKFCDSLWYATQSQLEIRKEVGQIPDDNEDKHRVVHWANNTFIDAPKIKESGTLKVIYIGGILPEKGILEILGSVSDLVKITNGALIIKLAGHSNDQSYKMKVLKMIEDNGLEDYVDFIGPVSESEKEKLLKESDISVALYPKYIDGSLNYAHYSDPAKLRDYLAYGLPIIVTKVPELHKQLDNYNAGISIDDISTESITRAFKIFTQNPEKYFKGAYEFSKTDNYLQYYKSQFISI